METNQTQPRDSKDSEISGLNQRIEFLEGRLNAQDFSGLTDAAVANLFAALAKYERIHGGSL